MLNRTPLYDWHQSHGARMVDFAGWDMPVQYSSIVEEHQAVRTAAGVFDISHMWRLWFQGSDALALVQRIYTNNAATLKEGQVRYGLVCNDQSGILDDVLVYGWRDGYGMVVNASNREKIVAWIARRLRRVRRQNGTRYCRCPWPRRRSPCRLRRCGLRRGLPSRSRCDCECRAARRVVTA